MKFYWTATLTEFTFPFDAQPAGSEVCDMCNGTGEVECTIC